MLSKPKSDRCDEGTQYTKKKDGVTIIIVERISLSKLIMIGVKLGQYRIGLGF